MLKILNIHGCQDFDELQNLKRLKTAFKSCASYLYWHVQFCRHDKSINSTLPNHSKFLRKTKYIYIEEACCQADTCQVSVIVQVFRCEFFQLLEQLLITSMVLRTDSKFLF